jgi:hypothetical protein
MLITLSLVPASTTDILLFSRSCILSKRPPRQATRRALGPVIHSHGETWKYQSNKGNAVQGVAQPARWSVAPNRCRFRPTTSWTAGYSATGWQDNEGAAPANVIAASGGPLWSFRGSRGLACLRLPKPGVGYGAGVTGRAKVEQYQRFSNFSGSKNVP